MNSHLLNSFNTLFRKEEVYAEAAKTLGTVPTKGKKSPDENAQIFPPFPEMVAYIDSKVESWFFLNWLVCCLIYISLLKTQQRLKCKQFYTVGNHKLPFNPATCTEV